MQINIDEKNTQRIQLKRNSHTLALIEDWYHDTTKTFLVIENIVRCHYEKYVSCNIIIGRERGTPTEDRGETPRFTMSYLKNNFPFFYREDYCFSNYTPEKRHRFLINAVHRIMPQILKAKNKDVIPFQEPVTLYAQSEYDRKKGTFDGWGYYGAAQKHYGETTFDLLIEGVEINQVL